MTSSDNILDTPSGGSTGSLIINDTTSTLFPNIAGTEVTTLITVPMPAKWMVNNTVLDIEWAMEMNSPTSVEMTNILYLGVDSFSTVLFTETFSLNSLTSTNYRKTAFLNGISASAYTNDITLISPSPVSGTGLVALPFSLNVDSFIILKMAFNQFDPDGWTRMSGFKVTLTNQDVI